MMTKAESENLGMGLYRVFWKTGGMSLAAIGVLPNGDRWLAPVNWAEPTKSQRVWRSITSVVLVHG